MIEFDAFEQIFDVKRRRIVQPKDDDARLALIVILCTA
jgi:hypothetical protein